MALQLGRASSYHEAKGSAGTLRGSITKLICKESTWQTENWKINGGTVLRRLVRGDERALTAFYCIDEQVRDDTICGDIIYILPRNYYCECALQYFIVKSTSKAFRKSGCFCDIFVESLAIDYDPPPPQPTGVV